METQPKVALENKVVTPVKPKPIDTYEEFQAAVRKAQFHKQKDLEVTKEFFQVLTDGRETESLTYGSPGIHIYVEGTKQTIEDEGLMKAELHYELEMKRKANKR